MPLSWSRDPLYSKRKKCSEGMLLILELQEAFDELGWEAGAEYEVCTAGCQTYAIDGHGTKWSPKKGTKKCNKDAFIVIKRTDLNS